MVRRSWAWLFILICLVGAGTFGNQSRAIAMLVTRLWWIMPLSASVGSSCALVTSVMFRRESRAKLQMLPTWAYLISGPSLAGLNLVSILPIATAAPSWVGYAMLSLLMCSAWLYYHLAKETDEEGGTVHAESGQWTFP